MAGAPKGRRPRDLLAHRAPRPRRPATAEQVEQILLGDHAVPQRRFQRQLNQLIGAHRQHLVGRRAAAVQAGAQLQQGLTRAGYVQLTDGH